VLDGRGNIERVMHMMRNLMVKIMEMRVQRYVAMSIEGDWCFDNIGHTSMHNACIFFKSQ